VSIVIPCHDHGEFLLEAIASVERHVTVAYELIVVNDGSREPSTLATLDQLRLAGYRVIDQEQSGLATARNRGIAEARAPIFLPLDADNRLRAGFVESGLQRLARDRAVVAVYGDRVEFGGRTGRVLVGVPDLNRLLCGNYIDACALIRVDAWRACGGYDANMPAQGAEDWDLWLSMLERDFVLARLDIAAFDYRVRPDSMLARFADLDIQLATERYVLAKHAPLYLAHLRRQVDRLDASDAALAEARAQLAALQAQAQAAASRTR
jgi:glycosyltransferase involved in cell wall biosynthesis